MTISLPHKLSSIKTGLFLGAMALGRAFPFKYFLLLSQKRLWFSPGFEKLLQQPYAHWHAYKGPLFFTRYKKGRHKKWPHFQE